MSARFDTFAASQRERSRRLAMDPSTPGYAQAAYLSPSWDALYGSLRENAEAAGADGYSLSGAGYGRMGGGVADSANQTTDRTNAVNAYLGDLTDKTRLEAERLKQTRAQTAMTEAAARDVAGQEQDQAAIDRALQTGGQPGRAIQQNPDGSYETGAPEAASPAAQRANILKMLPGHLQPIFQKQWEQQDAALANTDLAKAKAEGERAKADAADNAGDDVSAAVTAMKEGTVPPQLPGRASKDYTKILAEAKRQGYDLATAATDWTATQKHVQTMNGAQQLRLNQAVNALPEMLDSVDSLASKWKAGKFPALNNLTLKAAKAGALGPDAATIANQLDAQIADVTADLGNVYMGGNSPTDHALELAGKSLKADWDERVLHDMVTLAKKNVQIRQNSIRNTGVQGASATNPYGSQRPGAAAPSGETPDARLKRLLGGG